MENATDDIASVPNSPKVAPKNPLFTDEFLRRMPKTDLHVHLDGSIRPQTLIDLAEQEGIELPGRDVKTLHSRMFKTHYSSLVEYLQLFTLLTRVLQRDTALER